MRAKTPVLCSLLAVAAQAQSWATIPAGFDVLPGNAAVSLPLRWSWGRMQVIYDRSLLTGLQGGTINRIRLRQPAARGEPAAAAVSINLEIGIGESPRRPRNMSGNLEDNVQDPSFVAVYGPRTLSVSAAPAPGVGDALGTVLVDVPLDRPFAVPTGREVVVQWRAIDQAFSVRAGNWVDAVWIGGAADRGLAIPVGRHGCGGVGPEPMRLDAASGSEHPAFGQATELELSGAAPASRTVLVFGLDPTAMQVPFAFGQSLAPFLPGCHLFTPLELPVDAGSTDAGGRLSYRITLPAPSPPLPFPARIGVQAFVLEAGSLAASNGVVLWMDSIGLGDRVATALGREDETFAPWLPFVGLCPVVGFGQ